MLTRLSAVLLAGLTVACAETPMPTGITESPDAAASQSLLAELSCRVDAAKRSMSCEPPKPLSVAGRSSDLILGGQNTYVKLTSSGITNNGTTLNASVTVQNLTGQPWGTTDGTTPDATGVRVFFSQAPTNGVTVANADGTATFTAAGQPYFQYSGAELGLDQVLRTNEISSPFAWNFTLNGATTFTFTVYISAKMPDEPGVLRWTRSVLSEAAASEERSSVWGTSSTDVWAGGTAGATALQRWDGTSWTAASVTHTVAGLWGSSASNVYAVGGTSISQFNGTSWSAVTSGASSGLLAVWGSSASDVYAGGLGGTLVRSTGGAFSTVPSTGIGGAEFVAGIWGSGANDVYVVGTNVRRWNGTTWSTVATGIGQPATDVWGTSASNIYIGGFAGAFVHYNGTTWSSVTGCGTADVGGIWGTAANDVYMVNRVGEICHYNGTSWSIYTTVATTGFNALWGSGRLDVWGVGGNLTFVDNVVVRGTR